MKLLLFYITLIFAGTSLQAQWSLGDIAFTGYQGDNIGNPSGEVDQFSFVLLRDISTGESIAFTERGWLANGGFRSGENTITAQFNASHLCGTQISIDSSLSVQVNGVTNNTIVVTGDALSFATSGDQIFAYNPLNEPTSGNELGFIAAIQMNGGWDSDATSSTTSAQPAIFGSNAGTSIAIDPEVDNAIYNGSVIAAIDIATLRSAIHNSSNWNVNNTIPFDQPVDVTFSCSGPNLAPTVTAPSTPVVFEDAIDVVLSDDIQITDAEDDDQTITITVRGGTVTLGVSGITFGGSGNGSANFTAQGTLANINTALDAATFTPTANLNGANVGSIAFVSNDGTNTSNSAETTFSITAINDEPSFTVGADETVNEDAGAQTVNAWATSINAGATNESAQTLSFTVTNDNNALFSTQPAIDASGNLTYTPANDASGAATVSVILSDNGGTANGGDDTFATQTFDITVNPVNDEPSFTPGANETVNEDAGAQTVNAWATGLNTGATNESAQTLSFAVTNDNNALFSAQPAIDASGNLTYTPANDASGAATVSVILSDNGGTANGGDDTFATQTFDITVNPVNDEPSFTAGADETVNEDAGAQVINNWATLISAGPADENGQLLNFTLTNDNNDLFSIQPAIDASGNLTYTPAADAFGSATVSIILSDNGGTSNGGDDTFTTQQFLINVNQVNDTTPVVSSITADSGISNTDFITNDNRPSISGTAEPGSRISIFVNFGGTPTDSNNFDVFTIADSITGTYTIDYPTTVMAFGSTFPVPDLPEGSNDFQVVSRLNGVTLTSLVVTGTIDTTNPTASITSIENSPTVNQSFPISITFNEVVTDFELVDISVGNGTASNLATDDDITFTATITAATDGVVTVEVAGGVSQDIAGNNNEVTTQFSITYNDPALSLGENTLKSSDFSFVNPVGDLLIINSSVVIKSVTLYSMSGTIAASARGNEVDTSTMSSGIYIASIVSENGNSATAKILKK